MYAGGQASIGQADVGPIKAGKSYWCGSTAIQQIGRTCDALTARYRANQAMDEAIGVARPAAYGERVKLFCRVPQQGSGSARSEAIERLRIGSCIRSFQLEYAIA